MSCSCSVPPTSKKLLKIDVIQSTEEFESYHYVSSGPPSYRGQVCGFHPLPGAWLPYFRCKFCCLPLELGSNMSIYLLKVTKHNIHTIIWVYLSRMSLSIYLKAIVTVTNIWLTVHTTLLAWFPCDKLGTISTPKLLSKVESCDLLPWRQYFPSSSLGVWWVWIVVVGYNVREGRQGKG